MSHNDVQLHVLYRRLLRSCGVASLAFGCTAMAGWLLNAPFLASLGQGFVPMAPSTAILFALYGIGILISPRVTCGRRTTLLFQSIFTFGALISATLLVLSISGIFLNIEHLGFHTMGAIDGTPIGHMSPITAFTFLLISGLIVPLVRRAVPVGAWRYKAPWWAAIVLIAVYAMLVLAYLLGTPLFYGGDFIPPAVTTSLGFIALGIALSVLFRPRAWPEAAKSIREAHNHSPVMIILFIFMAAGIISVGYFYHRNHQKQYLAEVGLQLSAIADLKVNELQHWREERTADAGIFYHNAAFASLVKDYVHHSTSEQIRREIEDWTINIRNNHNYTRVILLDARGKIRFSLPEMSSEPLSYSIHQKAAESLRTGRITFTDFYRNASNGKIYLSILAPIFDPDREGTPLGVLVLRIDPERYLYPFIQRWPNASTTAETLLVHRYGADVVFLNDLRFKNHAALNLKFPLTRTENPAVMAVMGREGIVRGTDYRGHPVIAALRNIPDSPWYLVARMDAAEVYAPMRERLWGTVLLISAMLLSAATGLGLVWRQQSLSYYRNADKQFRQNRERLQSVLNVFQFESNNMKELLDFTLNEAIGITSSKYGYIYYYDEEKKQFILNSWSRDVMHACSITDPQSVYDLDKTGIWGEAVRQRRPIMVNDFDTPDPLLKGYPEGHVHLSRFLTIPHFDQGKIVAVVGVANKETDYDDSDVLQLTLLIGSAWKIAERRRVEADMSHQSALLRRIIDSIPDLIFYKDVKSTFLGCNKAFERFAGRTEREQVGKTDFDFFDHELAEFFQKKDREMLATCQSSSNEEWVTYPDGTKVLLDTLKTPFCGIDGKLLGLVGISRDITERKLKEQEIEEKNAELERFTYTVSHDLKSPLVTIKTFLGYLEADIKLPDNDRIQQDLGFMHNAADKMSQLLNELLELSRVGRINNPPQNVAFMDVVNEAVRLDAGRISKRGVMVKIIDSPVMLCGDRARLVEIWQNLVENAVKYSGDEPAPSIEIGCTNEDSVSIFFVRDNGIGIDPPYHEKIFSLFDKLDSTSEGTGLGLALVKRIVELYGGKIWVESQGNGHGSCFRFTLPEAIQK
ncbi:MAG: GAF domain-containing protein [Proteobacteria bacterium]|nr:GAF domain-containing protein [Pseudomonadota bacterium]